MLQYLYKLNSIKNHNSKKMYKRYLILISAAFNWLSLPTISTYNIMFEALSQHILYLFCVICAVGMLQRACVYSVCLRSFGFTRTMHHTIIVKSEARTFLMVCTVWYNNTNNSIIYLFIFFLLSPSHTPLFFSSLDGCEIWRFTISLLSSVIAR